MTSARRDPGEGQWKRHLEPDEHMVSRCDFSPGPWWGFNGIRTLVATDRRLIVVRRSGWPKSSSYDYQAISKVNWYKRKPLLGHSQIVMLRVHLTTRNKVFASKHEDADEFAKSLDQLLSRR